MREVPSPHDFFDRTYVKQWATEAGKNPHRKAFLDAFVKETRLLESANLIVLELGSGPGYLAERLLKGCSTISTYYLLDTSPYMHELSRARLRDLESQTVFIEADFKHAHWAEKVLSKPDLIVAQQAVHELRCADRIPRLYSQVCRLLAPAGAFLMCDLINNGQEPKSHLLTVEEHIRTLEATGFTEVTELLTEAGMTLIRALARISHQGATKSNFS